ncbi:uncharacterized protein PGTG_22652 [Puccinia graminis f. sp. tritici CRL 75-36-700-3]|uniref:Uncharacterized protein n=1 Tax=Puccinia graminis f. sp. tritici (strain CRL 75-36-700-3 / race SCCL) TaxID=418459 RepID=H6QV63_PUCGT|nr:uncharacterized protein PGTG_22652 [Puccinia graminis f. sp. tritici CRL 75-36-700-3]EHS62724.1 hypothetical protein PGTG_22652 [Puccinia graminis f. sp. tritici CRL 75-36-700-3]
MLNLLMHSGFPKTGGPTSCVRRCMDMSNLTQVLPCSTWGADDQLVLRALKAELSAPIGSVCFRGASSARGCVVHPSALAVFAGSVPPDSPSATSPPPRLKTRHQPQKLETSGVHQLHHILIKHQTNPVKISPTN